MNEEIKERLEQIRRGEIPNGYRRTKAGIIPEVWKVRQFVDIFQFISNNSYSRVLMTDSGGEIRNIHYGDVLIKYHAVIDCAANDLPFLINSEKIRQDMLLKSGDIIIADTAEDLTAGKAVEITNVGNHKVVSGLHTMACRPAENLFAPKWLGYYMDSAAYHNQLIPLICGAKVSSISKGEIINTVIAIPPLAEQQQIAEILSAQDSVIELKERLVTEKQRQKKYLMQQLLTGKQRLPGFTDDWKPYIVGKIGEFYGGLSGKSKDDFGTGAHSYITFKNVLENTVINPKQVARFRLNEGEKQNAVKKFDLFFNLSSETAEEVGMCAVLLEDLSNTYLNSFCIGFRTHEKTVLAHWLSYYFNSPVGREKMRSLAQGITRVNLNRAAFSNMTILIPSMEEQNMIAGILSAADREIELLRASLEQEKQKKKALSQLLLTGIVRV